MPDVGRVRRRVVAMVPERAKDRLRRALGRGPAPRPHASLVVRHEAGLIHYSGAFRDPVRVVALVVRPASRLGQVSLRLEQQPSADFAFTVDPVQLWELGGRAAGRFDLFVEVDGAGTKRTELRLGRFDHTDTSAAMDRIEVEGAASPFGEQAHAWTHVTDQGNVSVRYAPEPIGRFEVEGRRLDVGPRGISADLVLTTFSRPARGIHLALQWRFSGVTQQIPVTVEPIDATGDARPVRLPDQLRHHAGSGGRRRARGHHRSAPGDGPRRVRGAPARAVRAEELHPREAARRAGAHHAAAPTSTSGCPT